MSPAGVDIVPFQREKLDSLLDRMNDAFTGRRGFAGVQREEFCRRVLEHPGFEPEGLLLAVESSGEVLGFAHAIIPPVQIPQYSRLEGRGFLFGPYVHEAHRGRGIGRALLKEAERILAERSGVVLIHGLRSPFYHTQEGPRQPYFGSTEVLGLTTDDRALLSFLMSDGYELMEEREVSMSALLTSYEIQQADFSGLSWTQFSSQNEWTGSVRWVNGVDSGYGYDLYAPMADHTTIAVVKDYTILGHCQWYPMRRAGRAVLFDLRLDPSLRGRGLGRWLFYRALAAMQEAGYVEVELHTSPQRNAVAYQMYRKAGFREVASWVMLHKKIHSM